MTSKILVGCWYFIIAAYSVAPYEYGYHRSSEELDGLMRVKTWTRDLLWRERNLKKFTPRFNMDKPKDTLPGVDFAGGLPLVIGTSEKNDKFQASTNSYDIVSQSSENIPTVSTDAFVNQLDIPSNHSMMPIFFTNPATGIVYAITEVGVNKNETGLPGNGSIPIFVSKEQYERDLYILKRSYESKCYRQGRPQITKLDGVSSVNKLNPVVIKSELATGGNQTRVNRGKKRKNRHRKSKKNKPNKNHLVEILRRNFSSPVGMTLDTQLEKPNRVNLSSVFSSSLSKSPARKSALNVTFNKVKKIPNFNATLSKVKKTPRVPKSAIVKVHKISKRSTRMDTKNADIINDGSTSSKIYSMLGEKSLHRQIYTDSRRSTNSTTHISTNSAISIKSITYSTFGKNSLDREKNIGIVTPNYLKSTTRSPKSINLNQKIIIVTPANKEISFSLLKVIQAPNSVTTISSKSASGTANLPDVSIDSKFFRTVKNFTNLEQKFNIVKPSNSEFNTKSNILQNLQQKLNAKSCNSLKLARVFKNSTDVDQEFNIVTPSNSKISANALGLENIEQNPYTKTFNVSKPTMNVKSSSHVDPNFSTVTPSNLTAKSIILPNLQQKHNAKSYNNSNISRGLQYSKDLDQKFYIVTPSIFKVAGKALNLANMQQELNTIAPNNYTIETGLKNSTDVDYNISSLTTEHWNPENLLQNNHTMPLSKSKSPSNSKFTANVLPNLNIPNNKSTFASWSEFSTISTYTIIAPDSEQTLQIETPSAPKYNLISTKAIPKFNESSRINLKFLKSLTNLSDASNSRLTTPLTTPTTTADNSQFDSKFTSNPLNIRNVKQKVTPTTTIFTTRSLKITNSANDSKKYLSTRIQVTSKYVEPTPSVLTPKTSIEETTTIVTPSILQKPACKKHPKSKKSHTHDVYDDYYDYDDGTSYNDYLSSEVSSDESISLDDQISASSLENTIADYNSLEATTQQVDNYRLKKAATKKRIKRKRPYNDDYDDYGDDYDEDENEDGGVMGIFRGLFSPVQWVMYKIFDRAGHIFDDSPEPETNDNRKPKYPQYTVYNSGANGIADSAETNGDQENLLGSWFGSWFGFRKRRGGSSTTTVAPVVDDEPGWFDSWFGYDVRTPSPDEEEESDPWFFGWFGGKTRSKRTTTTTTTTPVPILTIADPMKNPQNWIGILAQHIINSTSTNSPLTDTSSENPDIAKRISYDKYQIWRLKPNDDSQVKVLEDFKRGEEGARMQWLKGPTLRGLTDVLIPPKMLTDFQGTLNYENIAHEILIFDVGKVISYEQAKQDDIPAIKPGPGKPIMSWNRYYDYDSIIKYLELIQVRNPQFVELIHIGRSYEGRPLVIAKVELKDSSAKQTKKKKLKLSKKSDQANGVFIEAGIHGREWIAPASATWMINELLKIMKNNRTNLGTEYIKNTTWYIMPVSNPDSYEYSHQYDRLWKKSRSRHIAKPNGIINSAMTWLQKKRMNKVCFGVDLDCNWHYNWGRKGSSKSPCNELYAGPSAFSEPETRALSKFLMDNRKQIRLFTSLQAYGQIISYPNKLNSSFQSQKLDDLFDVAMVGTDGLRKKGSKSRYKVNSSNDLIENKSGSSDYFATFEVGIPFSYTIHLADNGVHGFLLPSTFIEPTARDAFEIITAMIDYI